MATFFGLTMDNESSTFAMVNVLSKRRDGFKVCHLNARSLNINKLDYLRYLFANSCVDVICVSETWFKSDFADNLYNIPTYTLYRNDRITSTIGGGVAIYCKSALSCRIVSKSVDSGIEYLIAEIHDCCTKCIVSCVYNPKRSYPPDTFFSSLSEFSAIYEHIIICGDFNVDLLRTDSRAFQVKDCVSSLGLKIVNHYPTRFCTNSAPSLLDLIIVSDPSSVLLFDQLSLEYISGHVLLV